MNLDNHTLSLLFMQIVVISSLGSLILLLRVSAATRVWCIRLTVLFVLVVAIGSQLSLRSSVPVQAPIMLPPAADTFTKVDTQLRKITFVPGGQTLPAPIAVSLLRIWEAGLLVGFCWTMSAYFKLLKLRRNSRQRERYMGMEVRTSSFVPSPLVAGLLRPVIYIPEALYGRLQPDDLDLIYSHEMAHVAHKDIRWKVLHRLTCLLLWPNLVLWLLIPPHDRAMEELADAKATLTKASPERYASLLLDVAEQRNGKDVALGLAMARRRSRISERITKILNGDAAGELAPLRRTTRVLSSVLALGFLASLMTGFGWQNPTRDTGKYPWQSSRGIIDIRVLAPDGTPAKDAKAWLQIDNDAGMKCEPLPMEGNTGHIDLSHYPSALVLRVLAKDALGNVGSTSPAPGSSNADLNLVPTATVHGVLVRPDGSPESGVRVSANVAIRPAPNRYTAIQFAGTPLERVSMTDSQGWFSLDGIPQTSVLQVTIADPSVQAPMPVIENGNGRTYGLQVGTGPNTDLGRIGLQLAGQVSGHLVLVGQGIAGVRVAAQIINDDMFGAERTGAVWSETVTDANGAFILGGLGKARYNIAPFLPASLKMFACPALDSIEVEPGKVLSKQDLNLQPPAIIEGTVSLKGGPDLEGYPVAYYGPDHPRSGAWCGSTKCDSKGHFAMRVSSGKYYVYLQASPRLTGQDVTVQTGQTVHLTLKE